MSLFCSILAFCSGLSWSSGWSWVLELWLGGGGGAGGSSLEEAVVAVDDSVPASRRHLLVSALPPYAHPQPAFAIERLIGFSRSWWGGRWLTFGAGAVGAHAHGERTCSWIHTCSCLGCASVGTSLGALLKSTPLKSDVPLLAPLAPAPLAPLPAPLVGWALRFGRAGSVIRSCEDQQPSSDLSASASASASDLSASSP